MVDVSSFKGITYNKEKISNLDAVMAPPYDIIAKEMQDELYKQHPNNLVRLTFGKQYPDDSEKNNRYTRAKALFDEWQKQSILIESKKNAIYPYKIEYTIKANHEPKTMHGFFVLLKLDPEYKLVKAHEKTLAKPKVDCIKGYDRFYHKLWKLDNKNLIDQIVDKLNDKVLFIADGHHRYQTAVDFAREKKEKTGNYERNTPFNYRMVVLANMFDEGLMILPTHRLITIPQLNIDELIVKLGKYFTVEEKPVTARDTDIEALGKQLRDEITTDREHKFVLYTRGKYYILTLKDEAVMDKLAGNRSKTWRRLDVSILHNIVFEQLMGINEKNIEDHVKYTRVDSEAITFVNDGKFDVSFLMNATKIDELKIIAEGGEHMPQKSTYFLPKMLSGLVMYKM